MNEVITQLFRHNHWANLTLMVAVADLTAEQLALTTPGVYGEVLPTLHHLATSEQWYASVLTGEEIQESIREVENPSIELLRKTLDEAGTQLIEFVSTLEGDPTIETEWNGRQLRLPASIFLTQAIYHANEHRTNVTSLLYAHEITTPSLDGWSFGTAQRRAARAAQAAAEEHKAQ